MKQQEVISVSKLIREVLKDDIPIIIELLQQVLGNGDYLYLSRLGGLTNRSYKVTMKNHAEYLVRIPGFGTERLINRLDERKSNELACKLGLDSKLLYFSDDGKKVMTFIPNVQETTKEQLKKMENISQAANIFRKLHTCGEDTGVRFEVFEMASMYENLIEQSGIHLHDDYQANKKMVMFIKDELDAKGLIQRVPCHNDPLIANWVLDVKNKLYLIDWEYAGMNEPMWDLSCLSIEADYTETEDDALMRMYFNHEPTLEERKRFIATKLYVDFLWTLWGLTRVPYDGQFMQEYADSRYQRLKDNIATYNKLK